MRVLAHLAYALPLLSLAVSAAVVLFALVVWWLRRRDEDDLA